MLKFSTYLNRRVSEFVDEIVIFFHSFPKTAIYQIFTSLAGILTVHGWHTKLRVKSPLLAAKYCVCVIPAELDNINFINILARNET